MSPRLRALEDTRKVDSSKANAVKSSYKAQKDSLASKDFYTWLEMCYNTYMESAETLVDKDIRMSLVDQALTFKKVQKYLKRQAS